MSSPVKILVLGLVLASLGRSMAHMLLHFIAGGRVVLCDPSWEGGSRKEPAHEFPQTPSVYFPLRIGRRPSYITVMNHSHKYNSML